MNDLGSMLQRYLERCQVCNVGTSRLFPDVHYPAIHESQTTSTPTGILWDFETLPGPDAVTDRHQTWTPRPVRSCSSSHESTLYEITLAAPFRYPKFQQQCWTKGASRFDSKQWRNDHSSTLIATRTSDGTVAAFSRIRGWIN